MKRYFLSSIAALCLSSIAIAASAAQGPVIQILMENEQPMVINAAGAKNPLTLGTLLNSTAESFLTQKPNTQIDPKAIALIQFNKTGNETVETKLFDNQKRNEALDLGVLIAAAAQTYPGCDPQQINGKTVDIKLSFKTNAQGNVETFYTNDQGKEESFNLGTLLRETTIGLNNCK
jgi:hypothetical protein